MDLKTTNAFLNGDKIKNVCFSLNNYVQITNGYEKGKFGFVISLVSLNPEPIYLVELDGNDGDREIHQSSLKLIK